MLDAQAGSATWNLNATANWNTASNWTPNSVPNGPSDIATFGLSNSTVVPLSAPIEVDSVVFGTGAPAYSIGSDVTNTLTLSGAGIINNSGIEQTFVAEMDESGDEGGLTLTNNATTGVATSFMVKGGNGAVGTGAKVSFFDNSNAGSSSFEIFGITNGGFRSGSVYFNDASTAANGTFIVHNLASLTFLDTSSLANGVVTTNGNLLFSGLSSAGTGVVTISHDEGFGGSATFNGASADHVTLTNNGGRVDFSTGDAAQGTFTNNGATVSGGPVGVLNFFSSSTASSSTLIANGGSNGGSGGQVIFADHSDGGRARLEIFGNGTLDISGHNLAGVTIGSLEGDGVVSLGANSLTIGRGTLSTTFSGLIQGNGQLIKTGKNRLTLSSANTYTGGTTVTQGTLRVSNASGSATGSGSVQVNGGRIGGTGIIAGETTIGPGETAVAILAPNAGGNRPATVTIESALHFKGGTFNYLLDTKRVQADQVVANGVSIENQDAFNFLAVGNKELNVGQIFVAISNTAATAISGTFGNLPDGATFQAGRNKFQANYEGGDGNDLILTVIP